MTNRQAVGMFALGALFAVAVVFGMLAFAQDSAPGSSGTNNCHSRVTTIDGNWRSRRDFEMPENGDLGTVVLEGVATHIATPDTYEESVAFVVHRVCD